MQTQVQTTNTNLPATAMNQPREEVLKSDVVLPKILLMQGLSELVSERKAAMGDIVRSGSAEKLGDDKTPLKIIPLTFHNQWMVQEGIPGKQGTTYEFRGYEPRNLANEDLEWDYMKEGNPWKRTKVITLYALLPKDIEAERSMLKAIQEGDCPDLDKVMLPVAIQFKNTGFKAGREVTTIFAKARGISEELGVPVYAYSNTYDLECYADKNDKGTFFVYKLGKATKTSQEDRRVAAKWYNILSSSNVVMDETDNKMETKPVTNEF